MFKHHFKFSLRSLWRQRGYTLLNVLGLGIGMGLVLLIAAFVYFEFQTDKFHEKYHQIYRLENMEYAVTPTLTADFLAEALPEALGICRLQINAGSQTVHVDEKRNRLSEVLYADSTVFDLFGFDLIHGDPATALTKPLSVVLSESEARKLFGDEHPIGKTLKINNRFTHEVTGVMKDIPANSSIQATAIIPFHILPLLRDNPNALRDWNDWGFFTFVLLGQNHDLKAINQKVRTQMNKIVPAGLGFSDQEVDLGFFLRPFAGLYFSRGIPYDFMAKGNLTMIYIYGGIGLFILIIAVINFINLSTAMAFRRSREVGLRKVLGSSRMMLMRQYLTESVVVSLLSLSIGMMVFELVLPGFNDLTTSNLDMSLRNNPLVILLVIGAALVVGVLAGLYPATYLARFQPMVVLRGLATKGKKGALLRKVLIVFQFTISIGIILSTLVIFSQMRYARTKDMGFNRENVIYFTGRGKVAENFEAFKAEIKQIPGVDFVALSSDVPGFSSMGWNRVVDTVQQRLSAINVVDAEFLDVYGLTITRGRGFDPNLATDPGNAFILNETAVKQFGLENPIGVKFWNGTVVGVVDDFSYVSVHHHIGPLVLGHLPEWGDKISVRLSGQNVPGTIEQIGKVWTSFAPEFPFNARFLDDSINALYNKEKKLWQLFLFFSVLAIFIACLGLSGLALFTTQQRTREVGIRKVLGSSARAIVVLLTSDFLRWVLLANLIAWPLTWYAMNRWLENFAFRITISWWMFVVSALIALVIALLTISLQATRAAMANPVKSLKHE